VQRIRVFFVARQPTAPTMEAVVLLLASNIPSNALAAGMPLDRPMLSSRPLPDTLRVHSLRGPVMLSARPASGTLPVHVLRGGARRGKSAELPWWASHNTEASGLFNNLRIPAALVAGAVISATFVLEPNPSDQGHIALTKKLHLFLGVVSLCCELLTIVSSTAAIQKLAQAPQKSASVNALLLDPEYEMYWVTSSVNFLLGLLCMTVMLGLRLFVVYGIQLITSTASLVIIATILMMLSFFSDEAGGFGRTTWRLPFSVRALMHTVRRTVFRRPRMPRIRVGLWRGMTAEESKAEEAERAVEEREAEQDQLPPEEQAPEIDWIPTGILFNRYVYLLWDRAISGSLCTLLSLLCLAYSIVLFFVRTAA
jgi:hypothetical protein